MSLILAADFGSTFTKLTAIDSQVGEVVACAKSFTTVSSNVMEGYRIALGDISSQCGTDIFAKRIASSSAAGGLRMISVGLVPDLTAKASRMAAASAGAKVLKTYSYELSPSDGDEITSLRPDIILLSGGIDGGNKDVILHNATVLSTLPGSFSVIVAGNRSVSHEVAQRLTQNGKDAVISENVMPLFGRLNIEPAREAIRKIFIKNIISAKGLDAVQSLMDDEIIPTPLAVYNAMQLLSRGAEGIAGLGELMAYDIGGATTDVYSMSQGIPRQANTYLHGLQEPFAKRSVEGDIGMRYSVFSLLEAIGEASVIAQADVTEQQLRSWVELCHNNPESLPAPNSPEQRIDQCLASYAIKISAERHCGFTEVAYTAVGESKLQTGKDLTGVQFIVGTGGVIINSPDAKNIMQTALYSPSDLNLLKPLQASFLIDKKNILTAMGLLSSLAPKIALEMMKKELQPL